MSRTISLLLAAVAVTGVAPLTSHASDNPPTTFCKLWWERKPSVYPDGNGNIVVDPGTRPYWVC